MIVHEEQALSTSLQSLVLSGRDGRPEDVDSSSYCSHAVQGPSKQRATHSDAEPLPSGRAGVHVCTRVCMCVQFVCVPMGVCLGVCL